eukprot:jgi/Bigna1/78158/fgenesh1_pg.52_\
MRRDAVMWVGVWSPPAPEPHSWTPVGWTDMSPQPPVTRQPDEGRVDLCSRFKVAFGKKLTDLSPQPPVTRWPSEGCVDLCSRFKVAFAEMALLDWVDEGVLLKLHAFQAMSPLGRGCCGWREASASNCNDGGFVSAKAGDVVVIAKLAVQMDQERRMHPPPSSCLPVRAMSPRKAGDVVAGVKQTMKVWSMGLFSWGSQVWCSCLVISKHEQTITTGFGDAWS